MTRRRSRRPADRPTPGQWHTYGYGHGHGAGGGMTVRHAYRVERHRQRHDRRRERRMRRRQGRRALPAVVVVAAVVLGVIVIAGFAIRLAIALLEVLFPLLLVGAVGVGVFLLLRRSFRGSRDAAPAPQEVPQATGREAWTAAKSRFDDVRAAYTAHECDPMAVLRRPALSDVSVASTARFVDAFAEAQALDTDTWPGAPHDAGYVAAVDRAARAWQAACDAADRIRLSGLPAHERGAVERLLKLLTTARDSDSEPERLAAYARARSELDRLDRAGIVHLPRPARAAVDEASRGALPG